MDQVERARHFRRSIMVQRRGRTNTMLQFQLSDNSSRFLPSQNMDIVSPRSYAPLLNRSLTHQNVISRSVVNEDGSIRSSTSVLPGKECMNSPRFYIPPMSQSFINPSIPEQHHAELGQSSHDTCVRHSHDHVLSQSSIYRRHNSSGQMPFLIEENANPTNNVGSDVDGSSNESLGILLLKLILYLSNR